MAGACDLRDAGEFVRGETHASTSNDGNRNRPGLAAELALGCICVGNICIDCGEEVKEI